MQNLSDILHPNALILYVDDKHLITWNRSATVNVWSFNPQTWIWTNVDSFSVDPEDEAAATRNALLWIEETTGSAIPLGLA